MSDLNEIIRAKDLQICELLAEIQVLKSKLQEQNICLDVSLNEISIDNTEITDTMTLNVQTNDVQTDDGMDVMNLLNMLMGEKTSSANPLMEMMQQMMGAENNEDPIMEMMKNMMGEAAQTGEGEAAQTDEDEAEVI
jgi:hypothetical protein